MHPEANRCGRISAEPARRGLQSPARRGFVVLTAGVIATSAAMIGGCSPSAPRFASTPSSTSSSGTAKRSEGQARFATREAEEEKREDDRKPDPKTVESVRAGTRSFRTEKNVAIKPLDQSKMMREISRHMGVPYEYGGMSDKGMDCSGYTLTVYKNAMGIDLARSASGQAKQGRAVKTEDLKFGDLVFFNTTGETASHVGIYLGDDLFAHASVSQGVTISSLESSYYKKRYEGARRILE